MLTSSPTGLALHGNAFCFYYILQACGLQHKTACSVLVKNPAFSPALQYFPDDFSSGTGRRTCFYKLEMVLCNTVKAYVLSGNNPQNVCFFVVHKRFLYLYAGIRFNRRNEHAAKTACFNTDSGPLFYIDCRNCGRQDIPTIREYVEGKRWTQRDN